MKKNTLKENTIKVTNTKYFKSILCKYDGRDKLKLATEIIGLYP